MIARRRRARVVVVIARRHRARVVVVIARRHRARVVVVIELLIRLITKVWYDLVPSLVGWEGYRGVGGRGSMWKAADWLAWFFSLLTAAAGFFVAAGSSVAATRTSCWAEGEGGMGGEGGMSLASGVWWLYRAARSPAPREPARAVRLP